jgi:hypothetical protein
VNDIHKKKKKKQDEEDKEKGKIYKTQLAIRTERYINALS